MVAMANVVGTATMVAVDMAVEAAVVVVATTIVITTLPPHLPAPPARELPALLLQAQRTTARSTPSTMALIHTRPTVATRTTWLTTSTTSKLQLPSSSNSLRKALLPHLPHQLAKHLLRLHLARDLRRRRLAEVVIARYGHPMISILNNEGKKC